MKQLAPCFLTNSFIQLEFLLKFAENKRVAWLLYVSIERPLVAHYYNGKISKCALAPLFDHTVLKVEL